MYFIFLFGIILSCRAQQLLFYAIDFCNLAHTCFHDSQRVCGISSEGPRNFLDRCDMLEFNCDFGKGYQEANEIYCANLPSFEQATQTDDTLESNVGETTENPENLDYLPSETTFIDDVTTKMSKTISKEKRITMLRRITLTQRSDNICCDRPRTWMTTIKQD